MKVTAITRPGAVMGVFLAVTISTLPLAGCATKAQTGAGVGALGGALVGSLAGRSKHRERNAAIGALIGGLIGYAVGNEMDKYDRARLNNTFERTPSYQTTTWVNPDTGNQYAVTPRPASRVNGRPCREAEIRGIINGRPETIMTTACRQSDGRWEMT